MDNQDRGLTIDNAISWLNDNDITEGEPGLCIVIQFCLTHGDFEMHFLLKRDGSQALDSGCLRSNVEQYTRFGESIGINKSIRLIFLSWRNHQGPINEQHYQCIQSFYRGIESNTSITDLCMDLECIGIRANRVDESLPRFNFQDAPITSNLEKFEFLENKYRVTTFKEDATTLIIQALQSISQVKSLDISCLPISESAFPRIISACPSPMNSLNISCDTAHHCSTLAEYFQSNRLMVSSLEVGKVYGRRPEKLSEQEASTIINGLKNGAVPLNTLSMNCRIGNTYLTSVQTLLCDTTSIESIRSSNHTLTELKPFPEFEVNHRIIVLSPEEEVKFEIIEDSLILNENSNKNKVIREKIAWYYFVGDFDVSPLSSLPVSVLPSVLVMIKGLDRARQSAIFRLLKSIPDLCNVGSRVNINVGTDEDIDAVKDGACGNKRRRKT